MTSLTGRCRRWMREKKYRGKVTAAGDPTRCVLPICGSMPDAGFAPWMRRKPGRALVEPGRTGLAGRPLQPFAGQRRGLHPGRVAVGLVALVAFAARRILDPVAVRGRQLAAIGIALAAARRVAQLPAIGQRRLSREGQPPANPAASPVSAMILQIGRIMVAFLSHLPEMARVMADYIGPATKKPGRYVKPAGRGAACRSRNLPWRHNPRSPGIAARHPPHRRAGR